MLKEIKAYTRSVRIEELVEQLEASGAPGVSVVEVSSGGYGFASQDFQDRNITPVVKIEIVCRDEQVEMLVGVILKFASTGSHGDGRIFVAPVNECIRIRDGKRGQAVL